MHIWERDAFGKGKHISLRNGSSRNATWKYYFQRTYFKKVTLKIQNLYLILRKGLFET